MRDGCLAIVLFALGTSAAGACSVGLSRQPFIHVVRMTGPKVEGLRWVRFYNVLDYVGDQRVQVSILRHGIRIPVVRWEDGQECITKGGRETCYPNTLERGAGFERYFDHWRDSGPTAGSLRRVHLPLIVAMGDQEIRLALRSQAVRSTRKLHRELAGRYADFCARIDNEE